MLTFHTKNEDQMNEVLSILGILGAKYTSMDDTKLPYAIWIDTINIPKSVGGLIGKRDMTNVDGYNGRIYSEDESDVFLLDAVVALADITTEQAKIEIYAARRIYLEFTGIMDKVARIHNVIQGSDNGVAIKVLKAKIAHLIKKKEQALDDLAYNEALGYRNELKQLQDDLDSLQFPKPGTPLVAPPKPGVTDELQMRALSQKRLEQGPSFMFSKFKSPIKTKVAAGFDKKKASPLATRKTTSNKTRIKGR